MSEISDKKPDEKYCQSCGAIIKSAAEICPKCGVNLKKAVFGDASKDEKYCRSCGALIKSAAEICPKCGVRQILYKPTADSEFKVTNTGLYIAIGVVISIFLSVFVGFIYFIIISSIYPNEQPLQKGKKITGILCLIVVVILVLALIIAGCTALLTYL
jgi:RNA polymerase subunit RPABC4/transcription elongation factor Spt4